MARQQTVYWTPQQYAAQIQGAKQPNPQDPGLHWKNGLYIKAHSQLPDGRVRIILTEGACTC